MIASTLIGQRTKSYLNKGILVKISPSTFDKNAQVQVLEKNFFELHVWSLFSTTVTTVREIRYFNWIFLWSKTWHSSYQFSISKKYLFGKMIWVFKYVKYPILVYHNSSRDTKEMSLELVHFASFSTANIPVMNQPTERGTLGIACLVRLNSSLRNKLGS